MSNQELNVYITGQLAGFLYQHGNGSRSFRYLPDYAGLPLSLSMPISNRAYATREVDAYFMGLLPDEEHVRRVAGRRFGASANNPFALLAHMGLDCPGAVQVCKPEEAQRVADSGSLIQLTEEEISQRLSPASGRATDTWLREHERWSLGGAQAKFALRKEGDAWYECHGGAATSHILKPGIAGMRLEALDEYLTMRIAKACGIPCEDVNYIEFCGVPAIVALRYDRMRGANGIMRLHQEDFCQALSVMPAKKYAEDGGPSTPDILRVLGKTTQAQTNIETFAAMLFFNYLTCSPDAHAKNYSLLHLAPNRCVLAPLYDVASALPYDLTAGKPLRMAMSIGGENRQGMVGRTQVERFADVAHLDRQQCINLMANLSERILLHTDSAANDIALTNALGAEELAERLIPKLKAHCRLTLQKLE